MVSRKALTDLARRRQGLLVWHRLVAGHWMGRGDTGPVYEVKRDNTAQKCMAVC